MTDDPNTKPGDPELPEDEAPEADEEVQDDGNDDLEPDDPNAEAEEAD